MPSTVMTGWLLDGYDDPRDGVVVWFLADDGSRLRLRQDFPVTFYVGGPAPRLRQLWRYLESLGGKGTATSRSAEGDTELGGGPLIQLSRQERRDLFETQLVPVLACRVNNPYDQPRLFHQAAQVFPELTYYDADLPLALRYAAVYNTFPLARCQVTVRLGGLAGRTRGSAPTGSASFSPSGSLPSTPTGSPPSTPMGSSPSTLENLTVLDTPWDLDPAPAPYTALSLEPDTNPFHAPPTSLAIRWMPGEATRDGAIPEHQPVICRLPMQPERAFLVNLRAILLRHDPDLLLTTYGDTWLLPLLLKLSRRWNVSLPLNRDEGRGLAHKPERSYFTYGQIVHRGQQYLLFGRWHIDRCNAMLFHDYGMHGVMELARVTGLPMQTVARVSPGTGISSMQILTALRQGVMVPWHKQQAERPKTVLELMRADQGGLVYQPITGLHQHVAEVDFVSMYPSIMAHFNVSPETVGVAPVGAVAPLEGVGQPDGISSPRTLIPRVRKAVGDSPPPDAVQESVVQNDGIEAGVIPALGIPIDQSKPGLIPQTLDPLLKKRLAFKRRLAELPRWHPARTAYTARASAHKWLLVTCFGYLGYKNARFGRIEAHEAVTAYGRECLLRAKEAAEDLDCTVLHMYVDGLWIKKNEGREEHGWREEKDWRRPADFKPLLDKITADTGLPIGLDGVYRWVAFLPSRVDERVPVPNRYFGVFQDGTIKMRGIEARRGDTPPFIAQVQVEMLERLAQVSLGEDGFYHLDEALPDLFALLRRRLRQLRRTPAGGQTMSVSRMVLKRLVVPVQKLVVTLKLSRALEEYRVPSPAARAAAQLAAVGKVLRPGQHVRFLHTLGEPGVWAWDLPGSEVGKESTCLRGNESGADGRPSVQFDARTLDIPRYCTLLLRAASTILQPLGVTEEMLKGQVQAIPVAAQSMFRRLITARVEKEGETD